VADGVVRLADVEEIVISELSGDPGGPPPPPHVHRHHAESFYVLEGVLALTAGERELRVQAGAWVQVPAGLEHAVSFAGSEPVRCLDMHTPSQ